MSLGLRHAALPAKDLQRALRFYEQLLGFLPYHVADQDWAMVCRGGTTLSLIRVPSRAADAPVHSAGTHPAHTGFTVGYPDEVDTLHEKAKSLAKSVGKIETHRDGSRGFYLLDSEGNQLEIIFIPQAPMQLRAGQGHAVVLLAHGSTDPLWRATIERLLERFRLNAPGLNAELAYMEMASPTLEDTVDRLATSCREIHVVPVFLSTGGHVRKDIPAQVALLAQRHPQIRFVTQPALGDDPIVQESLISATLERICDDHKNSVQNDAP